MGYPEINARVVVLQIQLILTLGGMIAALKNSKFAAVISCLLKRAATSMN